MYAGVTRHDALPSTRQVYCRLRMDGAHRQLRMGDCDSEHDVMR
jgi:hypothetical protein